MLHELYAVSGNTAYQREKYIITNGKSLGIVKDWDLNCSVQPLFQSLWDGTLENVVTLISHEGFFQILTKHGNSSNIYFLHMLLLDIFYNKFCMI